MMNDEESHLDNPTGANVKKALDWLCSNRQSDDILVFHYSGHGTLVPDDDPNRRGATEEAIVLSDMFLMVDDDIQQFFCKIPIGCQATFISDCCHSGGLLEYALNVCLLGYDFLFLPKRTFSYFVLCECNLIVHFFASSLQSQVSGYWR
jgi:Caspase domain